jgi:hypothetical protein
MQVNTDQPLNNLAGLTDERDASVYLHELCHFIQNVTTNHGLAYISVIVDYLKFATNHIRVMPRRKFNVPVQAPVDGTNNVALNLALFKIYEGDGHDAKATLTGCTEIMRYAGSHAVPSVQVGYIDAHGRRKSCWFGELCVAESMAYTIQRHCYPRSVDPPELPYCAADKLVGLIFPPFAQAHPLNVLALCDAAFKSLNPGWTFYDILRRCRDEQRVPTCPEEVYALCNAYTFDFNGAATANELLPISARDAIEQLSDYFNDPRFVPIRNWLTLLISNAAAFRQQYEFFPVAVATGGPITNNPTFAAFVHQVGTPLVTNRRGEAWLVNDGIAPGEDDYPYMWAVEQVYTTLVSGRHKACEMQALCRAKGVVVDKRCNLAPWSRHLDATCAFGQVWRHWELGDHVPLFSK